MVFEYDIYHYHAFSWPVAFGAFFLFLLATSIFSLIKNQANEPIRKVAGKLLLAGIVFTMLISISVKALINGGIYLCSEKEEDAIMGIGTIESICEPSKNIPSFKNSYNGHKRHGADVVIDGEEYFMITCEGFEVGDYVEIEYLPKSKFVLSIYKAEPPTVESDDID